MGKILKATFGMIAIGAIIGAAVGKDTDPPKPKTPEEIAREAQWTADVITVRALKNAMHDPKSFELSQALRMDDGTLCVTYRARNGFGALTVRRSVLGKGIAITSDERGFARKWNAHCGGKTGRNMKHLRYAL